MSRPLSAIISVPSWWGGLEIEVTTCWIRPSKIKNRIEPDELCKGAKDPDKQTIDLPLPGRAQDVLQKLGFFILRTPYLDFVGETVGTVETGRKAEIWLTGARLWKNPRVRLGQQWHDGIEVLPDMQGLITTFNCVEPSSDEGRQIARFGQGERLELGQSPQGQAPGEQSPRKGPGDASRSASNKDENQELQGPGAGPGPAAGAGAGAEQRPVQVWTSEGVTTASKANVYAFRPRYYVDGDPEKPCWLEQKEKEQEATKREEEASKAKKDKQASSSQDSKT